MSNAEKQRRYRERHLGPDGDLERVTLYLSIAARDQLDRLAVHYCLSLTLLVEELAARADRAVEAKLSGAALTQYRATGCEDDRPVTA
jgi:hypothetical protein